MENQKKIEKMLQKIEELRNQQCQQSQEQQQLSQQQIDDEFQNLLNIVSETSLKQNFDNDQKMQQQDQEQRAEEQLSSQRQQESKSNIEISDEGQNSIYIDINEDNDKINPPLKFQKYFSFYEQKLQKPNNQPIFLKKQYSQNYTTDNLGTTRTANSQIFYDKTLNITQNPNLKFVSTTADSSERENLFIKTDNSTNKNLPSDNVTKQIDLSSSKKDKDFLLKGIKFNQIITDISKNQNSLIKSQSPAALSNYTAFPSKKIIFSKQPSQVMIQSSELIKSQKISKMQSSQQLLKRKQTMQSNCSNLSNRKRNSGFLTNKAVEQLLTKMMISNNPSQQRISFVNKNKSYQQLYVTPQQSVLNSKENSPKFSRKNLLRKSYTSQLFGHTIQNNLQEVKIDDKSDGKRSIELSRKSDFNKEGVGGTVYQKKNSEQFSSSVGFYLSQNNMNLGSDPAINLQENDKPKIKIFQSSAALQNFHQQSSQSEQQINESQLKQQQNAGKSTQQSVIDRIKLLDIRQSIISEKNNENDYDAQDQISEENQSKKSKLQETLSEESEESDENQDNRDMTTAAPVTRNEEPNTNHLVELLKLAKKNVVLSNRKNEEQVQFQERSDRKHRSMNPMAIPFKRTSFLLKTSVFNRSSASNENFSKVVSKISDEIRNSLKRVSYLQSSRLSSKVEFKV